MSRIRKLILKAIVLVFFILILSSNISFLRVFVGGCLLEAILFIFLIGFIMIWAFIIRIIYKFINKLKRI